MDKLIKEIITNTSKFKRFWKNEILSNKVVYLSLFIILILGFVARVYRAGDLMGFYYDQGRDALVIWRLWHEGRPFLIGPVTGLAGIFLGPFYYYLIAPFYLLGGGNPVYPAVFLAFITVCGVFMLYYLGWKFHSRITGLIAAVIGSFSFYLVLAGRWLSNPTPIMATSMLFLYSLWMIIRGGSRNWWIVTALLIGISLQLESASAVFYLPIFIVFIIWQRKKLPGLKTLSYSGLIFFATLLPQILFNFRHDNLIINNFKRVLIEEQSFRLDFWQVLETRLNYFWQVFYSKLFMENKDLAAFFTLISAVLIISRINSKKDFLPVKLLLLFNIVPMIGYILFQGNFGNIYDYYMTGYYFPLILLFSIGMGFAWNKFLGKPVVVMFLILFCNIHVPALKNYLFSDTDGKHNITLGNEIQAVNWVFDDAKDLNKFKVDVYVPPVIPHSYDYLFLWQGTQRCGESLCGLIKDGETEYIYALYEVDPPHPERLDAWMKKIENWTIMNYKTQFGGVSVEKRKVL